MKTPVIERSLAKTPLEMVKTLEARETGVRRNQKEQEKQEVISVLVNN